MNYSSAGNLRRNLCHNQKFLLTLFNLLRYVAASQVAVCNDSNGVKSSGFHLHCKCRALNRLWPWMCCSCNKIYNICLCCMSVKSKTNSVVLCFLAFPCLTFEANRMQHTSYYLFCAYCVVPSLCVCVGICLCISFTSQMAYANVLVFNPQKKKKSTARCSTSIGQMAISWKVEQRRKVTEFTTNGRSLRNINDTQSIKRSGSDA